VRQLAKEPAPQREVEGNDREGERQRQEARDPTSTNGQVQRARPRAFDSASSTITFCSPGSAQRRCWWVES